MNDVIILHHKNMNNLIRTQISLDKNQKHRADREAVWQDVSLSEVIRRALAEYLSRQRQKQMEREALIERLAGAWKDGPNWKGVDAVAWQRKLRREKGI